MVLMTLSLLLAPKEAVCLKGETALILKVITEFEWQQLSLLSHVSHYWQVSLKSSSEDCFEFFNGPPVYVS